MKHYRNPFRMLTAFIFAALFICVQATHAGNNSITIQNKYIKFVCDDKSGVWSVTKLARIDNSNNIALDNDMFEILLFNGKRFTVDDYESEIPLETQKSNRRFLRIKYMRKSRTDTDAPDTVVVTYWIGNGPYIHKQIFIPMNPNEKIDRLQVLRFSSERTPSRGGFGEPVFFGNWFSGMDYPGFYSWHSERGNVENYFGKPNYHYKWFYYIDLDNKERELSPRDGLVAIFHFPGFAKQQSDGACGIMSKIAVIGTGRQKDSTAELALADYIEETRKPPRSNLQFNNWYSPRAKAITTNIFCKEYARTIHDKLAEYGAHLDNMVPDNGWQNTKTFKRVYEPKNDKDHEKLEQIDRVLREIGTRLGIWIALDGTNAGIKRGVGIGYKYAYSKQFKRHKRWMRMRGKGYFDVLDPEYQRDLKKSIRHLIENCGVNYIKHDFNHAFTSRYITERHAREACLDFFLEILAYERKLNPEIYQNYTNGSWFSPFWLQYVDTLWMMSGDSGGNLRWPQLSLCDAQNTYRDSWLHQSFSYSNFSNKTVLRPLLFVSDLMTHGIQCSHRKGSEMAGDKLAEWSDFVLMHFARGTMLKELYLTPKLLDEEKWKVLGMAASWAQKYQDRLAHSIQLGGDPAKGEVYGYISWVDGQAILVVRNPDRREQTIKIPFDHTVYYRGDKNQSYHLRAIYPFVEEMPWKLASGQEFSIDVPGDRVLIFELEAGRPQAQTVLVPEPLPPFTKTVESDSFRITLEIPNEKLKHYELLIESWGHARSELKINDKPIQAARYRQGWNWTLSAYDLRKYRGRKIEVSGSLTAGQNRKGDEQVEMEAWIVANRAVKAEPAAKGENLPYPISQNQRRVTQELIRKTAINARRAKRNLL